MRFFLHQFSWLLSGHIALAGSQGLMLVILAKLGSPQFVGSFALALAISGPIILFATLNQRGVLAASGTRDHAFGDHLSVRLALLAAALTAITGIALAGPIGATTALTIIFVGLARAFWGASDVFYGLFLHHGENRTIGISLMVRSVLGLVGLTAGLILFADLVAAAIGMAIGWLIPLIVLDLPATQRKILATAPDPETYHPRWDPERMWRLFALTLPLGIAAVLVSLNTQIPKYVIGYFLGADDLGYYAALAILIVAGTTIVNVLGQTAMPRLARRNREGDRQGFARLMVQLLSAAMAIGAAGFLLAWGAGQPILTLIYAPDYAAHMDLLYWLIAAGTAGYVGWVLDAGLTSVGLYKIQAGAMTLGAIIVLALSIALVPTSGIVGGAQALLAGLSIAAIIKGFALVRYSPFEARVQVSRPAGPEAGSGGIGAGTGASPAPREGHGTLAEDASAGPRT